LLSKVAVMEDFQKMAVRTVDMRDPGPGEVMVKIHSCCICTTDWQTWSGARASRKPHFPSAPGHEMGGEIVQVGPGVKDIQVGDHVAFGHQGCGECYYCKTGNPARCQARVGPMVIGDVRGSFGMGQYLTTKSSRIYKMNPDLPYAECGYLEPLATAIHGCRRLRINPGEDCLVIGAGNLGLVNAQVARAFGAYVMVSEIQPKRLALAKELGFATVNPQEEDIVQACKNFAGEKSVDSVIMGVGATAANDQAISVLGFDSKVLFFAAGYPEPELHIGSNPIHYREYELIGTMSAAPTDFMLSAKYLNKGTVKVDKLLSYLIPIDDVQHAFELAATPGNYRVALQMWE